MSIPFISIFKSFTRPVKFQKFDWYNQIKRKFVSNKIPVFVPKISFDNEISFDDTNQKLVDQTMVYAISFVCIVSLIYFGVKK